MSLDKSLTEWGLRDLRDARNAGQGKTRAKRKGNGEEKEKEKE